MIIWGYSLWSVGSLVELLLSLTFFLISGFSWLFSNFNFNKSSSSTTPCFGLCEIACELLMFRCSDVDFCSYWDIYIDKSTWVLLKFYNLVFLSCSYFVSDDAVLAVEHPPVFCQTYYLIILITFLDSLGCSLNSF